MNNIDIALLEINIYYNQPIKYFDKLVESIKNNGIREPLIIQVNKNNKNKYRIVDGILRYKAAKILGIKEVPCEILAERK